MRDLTEEELKLAPDGFLEYGFNRSGAVFFFNRDKGVAVIDGVDTELKLSRWHYAYSECKPVPIIKKPFDITKHDFSDFRIVDAETSVNKRKLRLNFDNLDFHYADLSKDDAIAIAKALGVTGEDLK